MSSGQWEVVGRNKKDKITTQNNKKPGKPDKKKIVPPPKVEDILPMSQVKSIYSDMTKSNKENKKPQEKENKQKETAKKQTTKKTEKTQDPPKPKPPKSIESALNLINLDEFKSNLENNKQRFPDAPLVWLKELSAFLNTKISVDLNDPVFTTKPEGYPLNVIPAGIKHVMEKALNDAGKPTAQLFYDISLTAMANDMSKGLPALGHKIWIQFLALNNPQLSAAHLDKHISLRTSYQNRQPIGLSILWGLGQGGVKDFHVGFKVFKEFMLPLLEMKNYSKFVVMYLSQLLSRHENIIISRDNYMYLLDLINTKRSIPNDVAQELSGLSKKLKAMLLKKNSEKRYSTFFEPLLFKLVNSANNATKNDISDTLLTFLINDTTCYSTWRQLYSKNIQQSLNLLKYISDNWKKISVKLDKKQFKQLLKTFSTTNTELLASPKKDPALQEAAKICKVLLDKMTESKSSVIPWKFLTFLLLISAGSFLAYDVNQNGCWNKTQSVRTLKQIGVWEYGEKAWDRANKGLNWTRQRIEEYAPGYLDAAGDALQPYVEVSRDFGLVLYNIGDTYRLMIVEKTPVVLESIEKYAPGLLEQTQQAWKTVTTMATEYTYKGYKYLTTEIFVGQLSPENMQKLLYKTVDMTQKYVIEYYNWVYEKVQTTLNGK